MRRIARVILAVIVGAFVWGMLWNLGTRTGQGLFPAEMVPEQPIDHAGLLSALILYSVGLSMLAGWLTALVAGNRPMPAVWTLALFHLALGIYFQMSHWDLMPGWYHLIFLALVVPATVWGGRRCERGTPLPARRPAATPSNPVERAEAGQ
jgi:hypothetical protein